MKRIEPILGPWPGIRSHHEAAQREARAKLLCREEIANRQAPENRTGTGSLTEFHRLWNRKREAA